MSAKTQQLQIRVSPRQKGALRRAARAAGVGLSTYVLSRLLPDSAQEFDALVREVGVAGDYRYALAELNDLLTATPAVVFPDLVAFARLDGLTPYLQNYVAGMVEQAAAMKSVPPPSWVREIAPLAEPVFASSLASLRAHLIRSSPVPFKRRNIYIDTTIGARV